MHNVEEEGKRECIGSLFAFLFIVFQRYFLVFTWLLDSTNAARILGIFPIAGKSHFSCNNAIMKSLHAAGHHVTMITPFVSETKIENFTYSRFNTLIFFGQPLKEDLNDFSVNYMMEVTTAYNVQYCYDVMQLKEIQVSSEESFFPLSRGSNVIFLFCDRRH